jgi:hypothetical protein
LQVGVVLVVTVREDEQLQVLQELTLLDVVFKLIEDGQVRSCELFESRHNRKTSLSLDKALVLERFELSFVEEGHATVARSLVEEVEVGVVFGVMLFLLRDSCLASFG